MLVVGSEIYCCEVSCSCLFGVK